MEGEEADNPAEEPELSTTTKPTKQKRTKPRRQSGIAVEKQSRDFMRIVPERSSSRHRMANRKGGALQALQELAQVVKEAEDVDIRMVEQQQQQQQETSAGAGSKKAASHLSSLRKARGAPASRSTERSNSSKKAPKRPERGSDLKSSTRKIPGRSRSSHSLKAFRKGLSGVNSSTADSSKPVLTGVELLSLRNAIQAQNGGGDDYSIKSGVESAFTMDSIRLRRKQIEQRSDIPSDSFSTLNTTEPLDHDFDDSDFEDSDFEEFD